MIIVHISELVPNLLKYKIPIVSRCYYKGHYKNKNYHFNEVGYSLLCDNLNNYYLETYDDDIIKQCSYLYLLSFRSAIIDHETAMYFKLKHL